MDHGEKSNAPSERTNTENNKSNPLRSSLKTVVDVTNSTLATLESTTNAATDSFASRLRSLAIQAKPVLQNVADVYQARKEYGPQIVAGAAMAFGGAAALRRGKIPGALVGAFAGTGAYAGVYGVEVFKADVES
mmetsp:Transcript_50828/g.75324  ORF Transcript_50828/g.75324 Transcript_50828/m.75324 type:complete len:134 (+) Transcript_50828:53-454(+)|eukprot:CAMPEP_0195508320 /NCGR_PEP_ID=MMETSP0794_2-20130614/1553_1 /TAXON_ID=515487 /ORGANISM="Stephanopyxis turris, Strain CCMP 815" /LENGTH=133 /DNA_ID=CAMNT_0040635243 /DNA_START=60 /DNA_END=461 /DNA_ORIENTATION=+